MAAVKVPLSKTYTDTGKPVSELSFRSPRWNDFQELGEIEEWQRVGERVMLVRYPQVVAQYAERLLDAPNGAADLVVLDLADTLAVHEAIRDFFAIARASRLPSTSSSGGSEKASTTSGD